MKPIKIFCHEIFYFTEDFKRLVREQKRRLKEIEILYIDTNMKITGGNIKEYYRIKLNLEHKRRKYIKMMMKEFQRFGNLYNNSKSQETRDKFLNILKSREEAFNYYYPKIKVGILCRRWKLK